MEEFEEKDTLKNVMSKCYGLILYQKPTYEQLNNYECEYFVIKHDQDVDENGVLKKEHWHVIINLASKQRITSIAKTFGVLPNLVCIIHNLRSQILYLTHETEQAIKDNKYKYDRSLIDTNVSQEILAKYYLPLGQATICDLIELRQFIKDNNVCTLMALIDALIVKEQWNCLSYVQKNAYLVTQLLKG